MNSLILCIAASVSLWAMPASAQGLNWFFCYAPNPATGEVLVSDMHPIGSVAERSGYGNEFSRYLNAKGRLPAGSPAYCVMRSSEREIARGQSELRLECDACGSSKKFTDVMWPRGGKTVRQVLAGGGSTQPVASAPAHQPSVEKERPENVGVYLMARTDETEITYTANQENGRFLTRFKADQRGGKWAWVMENDRCPGWMAVAYATNGKNRRYYVARGSADEGAASRAALTAAGSYSKSMGGHWLTGVLAAFQNDYVRGSDFSRGVIPGITNEMRKRVENHCADFVGPEGVSFGVRG